MDARDREKAFDKLLARTLRQGAAAAGAECPDANIFAAYFERSLRDADTAHWEAHFSTCARCQRVLAAMAVSEAEPLPVSEARAATASAARRADVRSSALRRWLDWRWLAPAAVAAAAVALWVAIRPLPLRTPSPTAPAETQEAKQLAQNIPPVPAEEALRKEATAGPASPATRAKTWSAEASRTAPRKKTALPPERLRREAEVASTGAGAAKAAAPAEAPAIAAAEPVPTRPGQRADEKDKISPVVAATQQDSERMQAAQARPAGVAGAAPPLANQQQSKAEKEPLAFADQRPAAPSAPPAVAAAEVAQEAGRKAAPKDTEAKYGLMAGQRQPQSAQMLRARVAAAAQPVVIASPNRAVLWRVGPGGKIEHSLDAGRTWQQQASNVEADLTAGAAPSTSVCWVVGRAGTILRTTDGEHWGKVAAPAAADWTGVEARDALGATVIAADGKRYTTADGGRSWRAAAP